LSPEETEAKQSKPICSLVYFGFCENGIHRPILETPSSTIRVMSTSIKVKILGLHFRHFQQNQITATFRTEMPRVSRSVGYFGQTEIIPGTRQTGQPSKCLSELIAFIEPRTLQNPLIPSTNLAHAIVDEFGVLVS
jgi:hypothetical protein